MTTRQLIEKIQDLPVEEQEEVIRVVQSSLNPKVGEATVRYASKEDVKRVSESVFNEYADLFRKLAQ